MSDTRVLKSLLILVFTTALHGDTIPLSAYVGTNVTNCVPSDCSELIMGSGPATATVTAKAIDTISSRFQVEANSYARGAVSRGGHLSVRTDVHNEKEATPGDYNAAPRTNYAVAQATFYTDLLPVGVPADGTIDYLVHVSGDAFLNGNNLVPNKGNRLVPNEAVVSFGLHTIGRRDNYETFTFGPSGLVQHFDDIFTTRLAVYNGLSELEFDTGAEASCSIKLSKDQSSDCTAYLMSTAADLLGFIAHDATGRVLDSARFVSSSGMEYKNLANLSDVPEPSSLRLFLILSSVWIMTRTRKSGREVK